MAVPVAEWRTSSTERLTEMLVVLAVAATVTAITYLRTDIVTYSNPHYLQLIDPDSLSYQYMASHSVLGFHLAPFCWRIGLPLLVRFLPLNMENGFLSIALVSIVLSGVAMYYVGRAAGHSRWLAMTGMVILLGSGWVVKYPVHAFWLADALSFLCLTLAVYFAMTRRCLLFLLVVALGVTVRESVLLIGPLYYLLNTDRPFNYSLALRTVALVVPAILVLVATRLAIHSMNGDGHYLMSLPSLFGVPRHSHGVAFLDVAARPDAGDYSLPNLFRRWVPYRFHTLGSLFMLDKYTVRTFGMPVMILAMFAWRSKRSWFLRLFPFLLLTYGQLLLAGDNERLLIVFMPAALLLALDGAQTLVDRYCIPSAAFLAASALFLIPNFLTMNEYAPSLRLDGALMIAAAILLVAVRAVVHRGGMHADTQIA